jgi:hypothetical protein
MLRMMLQNDPQHEPASATQKARKTANVADVADVADFQPDGEAVPDPGPNGTAGEIDDDADLCIRCNALMTEAECAYPRLGLLCDRCLST